MKHMTMKETNDYIERLKNIKHNWYKMTPEEQKRTVDNLTDFAINQMIAYKRCLK